MNGKLDTFENTNDGSNLGQKHIQPEIRRITEICSQKTFQTMPNNL